MCDKGTSTEEYCVVCKSSKGKKAFSKDLKCHHKVHVECLRDWRRKWCPGCMMNDEDVLDTNVYDVNKFKEYIIRASNKSDTKSESGNDLTMIKNDSLIQEADDSSMKSNIKIQAKNSGSSNTSQIDKIVINYALAYFNDDTEYPEVILKEISEEKKERETKEQPAAIQSENSSKDIVSVSQIEIQRRSGQIRHLSTRVRQDGKALNALSDTLIKYLSYNFYLSLLKEFLDNI